MRTIGIDPALTEKQQSAEQVMQQRVATGGVAQICRDNGGCIHRGNFCQKGWCEVVRVQVMDEMYPKPPVEETMRKTEADLESMREELEKGARDAYH